MDLGLGLDWNLGLSSGDVVETTAVVVLVGGEVETNHYGSYEVCA